MGGAELEGGVQARLEHVDGDDRGRADRLGGHEGGESDRSRAGDDDARARTDLEGVDHGAGAGLDAAAEGSGQVEIDAVGDLDGVAGGDQGVGGEGGMAEEAAVHDGAVVAGQSGGAVFAGAGEVQRAHALAVRWPAGEAVGAVPAGRERHRDTVTGLESGDGGADLLDDARSLMAEHERPRGRDLAVLHREIRVAQSTRA